MSSVQQTVERFNKQFPVGSTVPWRPIASDKMTHTDYTVSHPARDHYGNAVAFVKERSGMIAVTEDFVDYTKKED